MAGKSSLVRVISYLYVIDDSADREKDGADRQVFFSPDRFGVCPYENLCFYSQFTDRKYCAS